MGKQDIMERLYLFFAAAALFITACRQHEPQTGMVMPGPENIVCTNSSGSLSFSWDDVPGAEQYTVRLVTSDDDKLVELKYETSPSVTFSEGLVSGTSYTCKVRAVAGMEYSEFASSEPVVYTGGTDPSEPDDDPDQEEPTEIYSSMLIPASEDMYFRDKALAFPGAEGGGMFTQGGRGGKVIHVTSTEDSNSEGTLRWALNQDGARTIVFDVAGIIRLKAPLKITKGDLTVAGQTAPGNGICIADNTVEINADNVIIRFMRFRLGDQGAGLDDSSDAIWGRYHSGIILDHCSMSWSIDEVASFYANRNFTMQWCIISEALRLSGLHSKEEHGYGGIWGGRDASFHHNLLAHNDSRNARIDHPQIYGSYLATNRGNVDYRNNVIYNWGANSTYGGEDGSFNIAGNYYKPGPASKERNYFVDAYWYYEKDGTVYADSYPELYMEGNYHAGSYVSAINSDNYAGIYYHDQSKDAGSGNPAGNEISSPLPLAGPSGETCYTTTHQYQTSFDRVVAYAGASLVRDEVDVRIAEETKDGTCFSKDGTTSSSAAAGSTSANGMIDSQSVVGGWPSYSADISGSGNNDRTDTDGDGMPDWFENLSGLDPEDASDASASTIDIYGRYSNFEMYLHYLVREIVSAQTEDGEYTSLD